MEKELFVGIVDHGWKCELLIFKDEKTALGVLSKELSLYENDWGIWLGVGQEKNNLKLSNLTVSVFGSFFTKKDNTNFWKEHLEKEAQFETFKPCMGKPITFKRINNSSVKFKIQAGLEENGLRMLMGLPIVATNPKEGEKFPSLYVFRVNFEFESF